MSLAVFTLSMAYGALLSARDFHSSESQRDMLENVSIRETKVFNTT
jgi:hypothetical protein